MVALQLGEAQVIVTRERTLVMVGGVFFLASYAPMSIRPPTISGRGKPRWSVAGPEEFLLLPLSMAKLSQSSACVKVGPPLSCSGPRLTSVALLNQSLAGSKGPFGRKRTFSATFVVPIRLKPPVAIMPDGSLKKSNVPVF